jgi:hypothetical protein
VKGRYFMADVAKLKRQAAKAADLVGVRRAEVDKAIGALCEAERAFAVANEAVEQAEALETALELRSKKTA